jgi:hypothetical protein
LKFEKLDAASPMLWLPMFVNPHKQHRFTGIVFSLFSYPIAFVVVLVFSRSPKSTSHERVVVRYSSFADIPSGNKIEMEMTRQLIDDDYAHQTLQAKF